MRILVIKDAMHSKNKEGLVRMLMYKKYKWKFGTESDIPDYDLIISTCNPINTSLYPTKLFIFGPHFSVFPTPKLFEIKNQYQNSIYIQPSSWVVKMWESINMPKITKIPLKMMPFCVNTEKFVPDDTKTRDKVMVYFKRRKSEELKLVTSWLEENNYSYRVFDYVKRYEESDYLSYLQESKFGIVIDAHESQGFAIEEALSCNVPLLVWDAVSMKQEEGSNYSDLFNCTSIPYFNGNCGDRFVSSNEFVNSITEFVKELESPTCVFEPREFICDAFSLDRISTWFEKEIIGSLIYNSVKERNKMQTPYSQEGFVTCKI